MDIYAIITEKIINLLEQGIVPWRRPWTGTGLPRNLVSMKPHRGLNYFLLSASKYISPYWLTMRQANELGGHVRRGEESTAIAFWKVDDARDDVEDAGVNERDVETRRRFLLRYYRVWNLEQCELPAKMLDKLPRIETHQHDPIEAAERIIAEMPDPPRIEYWGRTREAVIRPNRPGLSDCELLRRCFVDGGPHHMQPVRSEYHLLNGDHGVAAASVWKLTLAYCTQCRSSTCHFH